MNGFHKLLITFELEPALENEYEYRIKKFLTSNEVIRGVPARMIVRIKNIGDNDFPGGKIKKFTIMYSIHGFNRPITEIGVKECPMIRKGEELELFNGLILPIGDGVASINIEIEAKDKKSIEYYQAQKGTPLSGSWINFFYVTRFQEILMLMFLEELLRRREND